MPILYHTDYKIKYKLNTVNCDVSCLINGTGTGNRIINLLTPACIRILNRCGSPILDRRQYRYRFWYRYRAVTGTRVGHPFMNGNERTVQKNERN